MCISGHQVSFDEKGLEAGVRRSTRRAHHKQSVGLPDAAVNSAPGPVHGMGWGWRVQGPQAAQCFSPLRLASSWRLVYTHVILFFSELAMICN